MPEKHFYEICGSRAVSARGHLRNMYTHALSHTHVHEFVHSCRAYVDAQTKSNIGSRISTRCEYAWQIHSSAKVPEQADSIRQGRDSPGNSSRKCAIDVSMTGAHHSVPFTTDNLGRPDPMRESVALRCGLRERQRAEAELAAANPLAGSAGGLPSRASRNSEADDASLQPI